MVEAWQLLQARPEAIEEDADRWERQAADVEDFKNLWRKRVLGQLDEWTGDAADVAKRKGREVGGMFGPESAHRLRAVADILRWGAQEIREARRDVEEALDEARRRGFEVDTHGRIDYPVLNQQMQQGTLSAYAHHPAPDLQDRISSAVSRATRADQAMAQQIPAVLEDASWTTKDPNVLSPREAARLVERAAAGDREALELLKRNHDLFSNPFWAKELMTGLGPKLITELPGIAMAGVGPTSEAERADDRALMGLLSDALAEATNPENPAWRGNAAGFAEFLEGLKEAGRADLQAPASQPHDGYWGLGQILAAADGHPPYSREFLTNVGEDMIKWDKQGGYDSANAHADMMRGISDPIAGLMEAAGTNPEGARDLLMNPEYDGYGKDESNLAYLLGERDWPDRGEALGHAIEAAGSGHDNASKYFSQRTVDLLADRLESDEADVDAGLHQMQDSIGRLLGNHIEDVNVSLRAQGPGPYDEQPLQSVLEFATRDEVGYKAVFDAELAYAKAEFDSAAETGRLSSVEEVARGAATVVSEIIEARQSGLEGDAVRADQANGIAASYCKASVGLVDLPAAVATGGAGKILSFARLTDAWIDSAFDTGHLERQLSVSADMDKQGRLILEDMAKATILQHPEITRDPQTPFADPVRPEDWIKEHPEARTFWDLENHQLRSPAELREFDPHFKTTGLIELERYWQGADLIKEARSRILDALELEGYYSAKEQYTEDVRANR
jgi:hypothetical protein